MADPALKEILAGLEELENRRKFNRKDYFEPYPKQRDFFDLGCIKVERLLVAGNQLGKTEAGAFETSCHLTGIYPDWWLGRRFTHGATLGPGTGVRAWACGVTGIATRDIIQNKLVGPPGVPELFGTGYIPKHLILDTSLARGVTDAYDTIQVRHVNGGVSTITLKSYEQGRTKFQGEPTDFNWCDEEPPEDIYNEIITRNTATKGMTFTTFTPLMGRTAVVNRFLDAPDERDEEAMLAYGQRGVVTMTIYDAAHLTPEERRLAIAKYPAHEREARAMGVPILGEGRIFPYSDEMIAEEPIQHVPAHWCKLWGIDFGIAHPFAAVLILWDKDNDVIHVHATHRISDQTALQHAPVIMRVGGEVPVAWPQDGTARQIDGKPLASGYKAQGLKMLPSHATWPDGSISTEAGIVEMDERFQTGRLKVARHLSDWFDEYRLYHRKDGLIVKIKDDLMSATRIACMMKRYARPVMLGAVRFIPGARPVSGQVRIAEGVDDDHFGA